MSSAMMQYLTGRALRMQSLAGDGIATLADWESVRKERRREFMADMSLAHVPEAAGLRQCDRGEISGNGYRMRRIGFEVLRNCWASACVYYPEPLPRCPAPAVLYVCGHAPIGVQHYQYNPQMWARRGYVCMILDTIEQSDNPGEHHGYFVGRQDHWISLGYTSAGGELLNSLRALDLLAADPAVDPDRLGATGISGGGALSFYLAIADERIKAVSTLCGISTPYDAIGRRRMFGHCDCFYPLNLYGRDISDYAALIAPRAALFCFGDNDALFHPAETTGLIERTRKVFELYGASDRCRLLTHTCGHENHPIFYRATQEWFDKYVAGEEKLVLEKDDTPELSEPQTVPFNGMPPQPNYLEMLPSLMCPRRNLTLPEGHSDWASVRAKAVSVLPQPQAQAVEALPLFVPAGQWASRGMIHSQHRGTLDTLELWIEAMVPEAGAQRLLLSLANPGEYAQHVRGRMAGVLQHGVALAALETRIAGGDLPACAPASSPLGGRLLGIRSRIMQAMALTGQTPVTMAVHDISAALGYLRGGLQAVRNLELYLHGRGEGAVAALHYAVRHDEIAGVILEDLPQTHADGAPVPGILNVCDVPELVGLLAPHKVAVLTAGHGNWNWATRVFKRLGCAENLFFGEDMSEAIKHLF